MTQCKSHFSQILAFFNRNDFADIVHNYQAEKHHKGRSCWDHFVAIAPTHN